jgi:lysophospholipase L1-like esterase
MVPAEFAYRVFRTGSWRLPPATWVEDPELIYKLDPSHPEHPGSFHGQAPHEGVPAGVRVVCLGGSTTYGHELSADQAWPHIAQEVLRQEGIRAEVLNAGVPGYGSRQLLLRYRRDIAPLKPDFVVLYEGWNRTGAVVDPAGFVPPGILRPDASAAQSLVRSLGRHSLLARDAIKGAMRVRGELGSEPWHPDPYHDIFVADFRALVRDIAADGVTPVLVVYPSLFHDGMSSAEIALFEPRLWAGRSYEPAMLTEVERKHAALRGIARETGAPLIDVQAALIALTGKERLPLFMDQMHMTVLGNARVGELIGNYLGELIHARGP